MLSFGVDLAGLDKNPTGLCMLADKSSKTWIAHSDSEILEKTDEFKPDIIAVDAPFSFPDAGYFRDSDKKLQEMGFKCLSPKFPGMQPLVKRAIILVKELRNKGYRVIEVFPHATEKITGLNKSEDANEHEHDAMLCALTGKYCLEGKFVEIGKEKIIVPK